LCEYSQGLHRQEAPNDSWVIELLDLRPFLRNFRLTYLRYDVYRGIPDFRGWLCIVQAAARPRLGAAAAGLCRARYTIRYVTQRTGLSPSYI